MRGVLRLILTFCLFAGLAAGAVTHAAELPGAGEVNAATGWLHSAGDHDEVPADADKNYPHHHSSCHGHDVAVPMKAWGPGASEDAAAPCPLADAARVPGLPGFLLRPPRA